MHTKNQYKLIGLMSGTSGDGLDIAFCEFDKTDHWTYTIVHGETIPFPKKLGRKLQKSLKLNALKLAQLDVDFGRWMGEQVAKFCEQHAIKPEAVASHGHTVFHQPAKSLSLQIGNGWALHQASGLPVINDFRMLDVLLGGQGAPLVPIGDHLLFSEYDYCLNLGGIANISMEIDQKRLAYDISPFNLLLNYFAQKLGQEYDKEGTLAESGKLLPKVFAELNKLPYYAVLGAKSLGREDLYDFMEILEKKKYKPENILHTLVEHYVHQIEKSLPISTGKQKKILCTGGGSFNTFFMQELQRKIGGSVIISEVDPQLIHFKEALVFAFLGVLRLRGETNCLASVTGATRDNCGGMVFGL